MTWRLELEKPAQKALRGLPPKDQRRILLALAELTVDPFTARNVKALVDRRGFRLRVGDYRVLYVLHAEVRVIGVERIGQRGDFYD
jgi:mRNA interferase RelE/StbE